MSDDMNHDPLSRLSKLEPPAPSNAGRRKAMAAAMAAFEAEQAHTTENSIQAAQGSSLTARLKAIFTSKRTWTMDYRLPLGTAAVALLLFPLGFQLYSTTSMTQPPMMASNSTPAAGMAESQLAERPAPASAPVPEPALAPRVAPVAPSAPSAPMANEAAPAEVEMRGESAMDSLAEAPAGGMAQPTLKQVAPSPMTAQAPAFAGRLEPSGDVFTRFEESRVKTVAEAPVSTFSIDVDTASYAYVRRMLGEGQLPEPDAVRIEEMINYFPYDYPAPASAAEPFRPVVEVFPTPWNSKTQLLHIGIKGYEPPVTERRPSNLVFLIDTSGSMDEPDKLPLLKRAFALLVDQLAATDTVSIVAYAGSAGMVLEPTHADQKSKILAALDRLDAGGSTAGAEGIELAYRLAADNKVAGGTNRVILATDGDFNVGISDPDALKAFIKSKRDSGISLSVLGFGQGNLDDATMQSLAQNGNGNASYIDSFREAQKVLVEELGGTLETIAGDVKIQMEFNPAFVSEYRLIGYETRALNREDFNNDKVDAGDVGAGTTVTALYEITPRGSGAELVDPPRYSQQHVESTPGGEEIAFLKMRYKLPEATASTLIETPITTAMVVDDIAKASPDGRFAAAVAAFGQKLRGSNYCGELSWAAIKALAQGARGADGNGYRAEFIQMIETATALAPDGK